MHVPDVAAAAKLGHLTDLGRQLATAFWPGALTLVLAKQPDCPVADLATAGLDTIAVRVPEPPHCAGPAARRRSPDRGAERQPSGHVSPTTAAHVEADLGSRVAMILDGGATAVGLESTVVDVTGDAPVHPAAGRRDA